MGILTGVRVLDFTQVLAGPFCTTLLGSLGADIIKVESWKRLDGRGVRFTSPPARDQVPTPPRYAMNNSNKRSLALDLSAPEGRETALRIAAHCDVVMEAFRPGVMAKLGLTYQDFESRNPSVLMVSISGNGNFGPESKHASYAGIFCALGGLTHLTGYSDGMPTEYRGSGDLRVGWYAALSVLAGIVKQRRTGRGEWIDLSGREVMAGVVGDAFLASQATSEEPAPQGNDDGVASPCGCFLSASPEEWVAISIEDDAQWEALCRAANEPEWLANRRFADAYLRWVNRDALNEMTAAWIASQDGAAVVERLQQAGVPAALSATTEQVFSDEHLRQREFLRSYESGETKVTLPRLPWISRDPVWEQVWSPPGRFAADTETVLREVAGLNDEEIERLTQQGVLA